MQVILEEKLKKLQSEIKRDYEEIKDLFLNYKKSEKLKDSLEKWNREKDYLKKHNFTDCTEAIEYAVKLELSYQELSIIIYHRG